MSSTVNQEEVARFIELFLRVASKEAVARARMLPQSAGSDLLGKYRQQKRCDGPPVLFQCILGAYHRYQGCSTAGSCVGWNRFVSWWTKRRAKQNLGVTAFREGAGDGSRFVWVLPKPPSPTTPA